MNNTFLKSGLAAALAAGVMVSGVAAAEIKVGGRIMVDTIVADEDDDNVAMFGKNGTEFRRARIFASGTMADEFDYKLQLDFSDDSLSLKDAWIATKLGGGKIVAGQHKIGGGLEEMTSSKYITMMERSMLSGLFPSRRVGLSYKWNSDMATVQGSLFGQEAGDGDETEEGLGAGVRATMAFGSSDALFHIGGSLSTQQPSEVENDDDTDSIRLRFRPENHIANRPISLTNDDADRQQTFGLEGAFVGGPFSVQAEIAGATVTSDDNDEEIDALGFAVTASYFIGGHKVYKKGAFKRPKINDDMAFELAARFSTMSLEQGDAEQDMSVITLGANVYFNKYTRIMLNYGIANADGNTYIDSEGDVQVADFDDDMNFLMARFQIDFK